MKVSKLLKFHFQWATPLTSDRDCVCAYERVRKRFVTVMRNITPLWLDDEIYATHTSKHTDRLLCQHSVIWSLRLLPAHHFLCGAVTAHQSTEEIWHWQELTEKNTHNTNTPWHKHTHQNTNAHWHQHTHKQQHTEHTTLTHYNNIYFLKVITNSIHKIFSKSQYYDNKQYLLVGNILINKKVVFIHCE